MNEGVDKEAGMTYSDRLEKVLPRNLDSEPEPHGATHIFTGDGPPPDDKPYYDLEPKPLPVGQPRVMRTWEGNVTDGGGRNVTRIEIYVDNPPSVQAMGILNDILPMWIEEFCRKNADYSSHNFHTGDLLGAAGQFAELMRKLGKLYMPMWRGESLYFEQTPEIVRDMIGHCFLTLLYLQQGNFNAPRTNGSK